MLRSLFTQNRQHKKLIEVVISLQSAFPLILSSFNLRLFSQIHLHIYLLEETTSTSNVLINSQML